MKDVVVIGVAGGTGSGKSTLVKRLQEAFRNDDVATICHDFYYKAHPELTYEERTKLNYDHPDAFDTWLLVEHIKALKEGKAVDCPTYSFVEHNRTEDTLRVEPSKVVIVDGILIFENEELRNAMDIKVYVFTPFDVIKDRWYRRAESRGKTGHAADIQFENVNTTAQTYIRPAMESADIVMNGVVSSSYIQEMTEKIFRTIDSISKGINL